MKMRLLIGADMATIFDTWKSPDRILELAPPLVMLREGSDADSLGPRWQNRIVPVPRIDISSSELRALLRAERWDHPRVQEYLDPSVLEYARKNSLYRP